LLLLWEKPNFQGSYRIKINMTDFNTYDSIKSIVSNLTSTIKSAKQADRQIKVLIGKVSKMEGGFEKVYDCFVSIVSMTAGRTKHNTAVNFFAATDDKTGVKNANLVEFIGSKGKDGKKQFVADLKRAMFKKNQTFLQFVRSQYHFATKKEEKPSPMSVLKATFARLQKDGTIGESVKFAEWQIEILTGAMAKIVATSEERKIEQILTETNSDIGA
jgi:hypothetical protein